MDRPYLLALLSEICAANGQVPEALALVAEALGQVRGSRTYFYEAELYRLRGVLVLQAGGRAAEDEAEANFRQALGIAKRQKARALELRAAVSLCRLLHTRGMPQDGLGHSLRSTAGSKRAAQLPTSPKPENSSHARCIHLNRSATSNPRRVNRMFPPLLQR